MDIAVGSLRTIVNLALQIKEAVDTVKQNKEVCQQIATRVKRLTGILSLLDNTEAMERPAMRAALDDLRETLCRALELVTACQAKRNFSRLFTAKGLFRELRQVNQDIMDQMGIANFANGVHATHVIMTTRYIQDVHNPFQRDGVHHETPSAGSEVNGGRSEVGSVREKDELGFTVFSLSEMMAATNNFSEEHKIGEGGFAEVYKAVLADGTVVAIKKFHINARTRQQELAAHYVNIFLLLLEHENFVRLLGYCQETRTKMMLDYRRCVACEISDTLMVEEFMPNGTLQQNMDGLSLDWSTAFRIVRGIARGVAYLNTKNVLHMDLKPANILLDSDMNPKICDFEQSQIADQDFIETDTTSNIVGTIGFMPPEYIADGIMSFKHDVFGFGVLLLRTISRSGLQQDSFDWITEAQAGEDVSKLLDPSLPHRYEVKRCLEIGLLCIATERSDRPTMAGVVKMLESKKQLPTMAGVVKMLPLRRSTA